MTRRSESVFLDDCEVYYQFNDETRQWEIIVVTPGGSTDTYRGGKLLEIDEGAKEFPNPMDMLLAPLTDAFKEAGYKVGGWQTIDAWAVDTDTNP